MLDVKGLTIDDIMEFDEDLLKSLNERELKVVTSRLVSASNKRLKRLKKARLASYSPSAVRTLKKKRLSVKGKTRNQTMKTFMTAKKYLSAKTSTVRGTRAFKKRMEEKLGGTRLNKTQRRDMWRVFRKYYESNRGLIHAINKSKPKVRGSDQIEAFIAEEVKKKGSVGENSKDEGDILRKLDERMKNIYEQVQEEEDENDNEGDFTGFLSN